MLPDFGFMGWPGVYTFFKEYSNKKAKPKLENDLLN
jgi:hypothetical protein